MKTMGKIGLCTAESYIGGKFFEPKFFEPRFLDTDALILRRYFSNIRAHCARQSG